LAKICFALVRNLVSHIPRVQLAASLVESNRARLTKMPQSETNLFLTEFMYISFSLCKGWVSSAIRPDSTRLHSIRLVPDYRKTRLLSKTF